MSILSNWSRQVRIPLLFFVGALLMQCAWILALPPFRGIDEFDHAYRAAAVVGGQWMPTHEAAANGRGELVPVPAGLARDARAVCESYSYTGRDNCRPVRTIKDGRVIIATAAARYEPVFYAVVGAPASPFDGARALYVMRLTAAAICAAFIALAGWCVSLWACTPWIYGGMLVALTPVAVYSTALPAPNGIEIVAGLALWAALLGFSRQGDSQATERQLLWAALPSALVLAAARQLGPMFLGLVFCTLALLLGARRIQTIFATHRRFLLTAGIMTLLACMANLWWVRATGALALEPESETVVSPVIQSIGYLPLWLFQTIAAFPRRGEPAPLAVYAIWLLLFGTLLIAGLRAARRRLRWAILGTCVLAALVPLGLTIMTISAAGAIWQGRYELAYTVGIPMMAALALQERQNTTRRFLTPVLVLSGAALIAAHAISVQNVFITEQRTSPLARDPSWLIIHPWAPAIAMALGAGAWVTTARRISVQTALEGARGYSTSLTERASHR